MMCQLIALMIYKSVECGLIIMIVRGRRRVHDKVRRAAV